ncbi:ELMO/CED-12 family protein, partial [Striga asiatica]
MELDLSPGSWAATAWLQFPTKTAQFPREEHLTRSPPSGSYLSTSKSIVTLAGLCSKILYSSPHNPSSESNMSVLCGVTNRMSRPATTIRVMGTGNALRRIVRATTSDKEATDGWLLRAVIFVEPFEKHRLDRCDVLKSTRSQLEREMALEDVSN